MKKWTFAQWGAWALTLPAYTRVFVPLDVFEALCLRLIANDRIGGVPCERTWCVKIRTISVVPKQWRVKVTA